MIEAQMFLAFAVALLFWRVGRLEQKVSSLTGSREKKED